MKRRLPSVHRRPINQILLRECQMICRGLRIAMLVGLLATTRSGIAAPSGGGDMADLAFLASALRVGSNDVVHCSAGGRKRPLRYSDESSISLFLWMGPPLGGSVYVNQQRDGDLVFLRAGREPGWPACEYPHFRVFERGGLSAWVFPFRKVDDPVWRQAAAELDRTFADHPEWVNRVEGLLPPDTPLRTELLSEHALAFRAARTDDFVLLCELLTAGLDPDADSGTGAPLLHRAAVANATNCVARLLERGVDPLRFDGFGRTPREEALLHGAVEAAALLPERPIPEDSP